MNAATILQRVEEAGVVGAGGAGFPTHVKLKGRAEWLICNGAECEPLLYSDQALMEGYAAELVRGLELAREATGARHVVIALKGKYAQARAALAEPAAGAGIELFFLDDFYPAGDEQVIVQQVTGRVVPAGGIPLDVGVVVSNVETLINVARAVDHGQPVTTKYLTVGGAVKNPVSVVVPVGVPVASLVELAGGPTVDDYVIMVGGVLMGHLAEPGEVVTKRTGGVIVLPADLRWVERLMHPEAVDIKQTLACIQCNFCTELCPRYLLGHHIMPHKAMLHSNYGQQPPEVLLGAYLCCECGLCEAFACPELLMPRHAVIRIKRELSAQGIRYQKGATPERDVHPMQEGRKVASLRVKQRLGIAEYDRKAPLVETALSLSEVHIPLSQHIGAPAEPVVAVGDRVAAGQVVGRVPEGKLGAPVHASVDGTVVEITAQAIRIACARKPGGE